MKVGDTEVKFEMDLTGSQIEELTDRLREVVNATRVCDDIKHPEYRQAAVLGILEEACETLIDIILGWGIKYIRFSQKDEQTVYSIEEVINELIGP